MDAVVNAESGLGAFGDGVGRVGDAESDIIIVWHGVGSLVDKVFSFDTDDFVAIYTIFGGFEKEDFVAWL